MNIITVKKSNTKIKRQKGVHQVPKYLSKGIAFFASVCVLVCLCVCALSSFVHRHRTLTAHLTCPRKKAEKTEESKQPVTPMGEAVRLEPFPKTRAFMRIMAWNSCVRPGRLTGGSLFKTGQRSHAV